MFISGPMTCIEDFNKPVFDKFDKMEEYLKRIGHSVFNPAWLAVDESWSKADLMAVDIAALGRCDAIVMLDGWERSAEALAEYEYAVATGKILYKEGVYFE